jgi:hypothetical protein
MSGAYRSVWSRTGYAQRLWANLICTQSSLYIDGGTAYENVGVRNSLGGFHRSADSHRDVVRALKRVMAADRPGAPMSSGGPPGLFLQR